MVSKIVLMIADFFRTRIVADVAGFRGFIFMRNFGSLLLAYWRLMKLQMVSQIALMLELFELLNLPAKQV